MSQQTDEALVVYADYVCPFCYLGYASLDEYRDGRGDPLPVEWHPFDLRASQRRPDGTLDANVETGKDDAYFAEARKNVERLADRYGVEMAQPLAREVDSYDAQRLALQVAEAHPDRFEAFHRGVFGALWEDGRDVGDRGVLEEVAADAGLAEGFVAETLVDDESAEVLEEAFAAAQRRRITGVPTFAYGEHSARGAVPPEQLRRLVEGT